MPMTMMIVEVLGDAPILLRKTESNCVELLIEERSQSVNYCRSHRVILLSQREATELRDTLTMLLREEGE